MISHITTTHFSGGSRGGARPPLLFLDQAEARKVEKSFWRLGSPYLREGLDDHPPPTPPNLKVCIRHCTCLTSKPSRPKQLRRRLRMNKPKIKYSGVDGLRTMFALFLEFGAERFPRISDLFSSRKTGLKFLI